MYLMYVDESGDCGLTNSPSRYFVLTGLVVHELRWQTYLNSLVAFRRQLRQQFGLRLREEFHAARFISRPLPSILRIKRHDRLAMIRAFADELAKMTDVNLINMRKHSGQNYFLRLKPILCLHASSKNPEGIVML